MTRQAQAVAARLAQADIAITTALIPGRAAPRLISAEVVASMKAGSVILDMAAEAGGNCELTQAGKTVVVNGVSIVGAVNLPAMVATDASALYARNVLDFLKLVINKDGALHIDLDDDIVKACLMCRDGTMLRS
jgi:NAD(P) transhydrogenase subunit alpha